jgi:hypothetical protein
MRIALEMLWEWPRIFSISKPAGRYASDLMLRIATIAPPFKLPAADTTVYIATWNMRTRTFNTPKGSILVETSIYTWIVLTSNPFRSPKWLK